MAFQYGPRRRTHPGLASTQVYGPQFIFEAGEPPAGAETRSFNRSTLTTISSAGFIVTGHIVGKASVQGSTRPAVDATSVSASRTTLVTVTTLFRYASSSSTGTSVAEASASSAHTITSSAFVTTSFEAASSPSKTATADTSVSATVSATGSHGLESSVATSSSAISATTSVKNQRCVLQITASATASVTCIMGARSSAVCINKSQYETGTSASHTVTADSSVSSSGFGTIETARTVSSSDSSKSLAVTGAIKAGVTNPLAAVSSSVTGLCKMTPLSLVDLRLVSGGSAGSYKNGVAGCVGTALSRGTADSSKEAVGFAFSTIATVPDATTSKAAESDALLVFSSSGNNVGSSGIFSEAYVFSTPNSLSSCVKTYVVVPVFIDSEEEVYTPIALLGDKSCARKPIRDDKTVSTETRPTYTASEGMVRNKVTASSVVRPASAAPGAATRPAKTAETVVRSKKTDSILTRPAKVVSVVPRSARVAPSDVRPAKGPDDLAPRVKKNADETVRKEAGNPEVEVRSNSCLP